MNHSLPTGRLAGLTTLAEFRTSWPSRGWSWDRRFECLASTIATSTRDEAWGASQRLFATIYGEKELRQAPPLVQKVASDTGGVRSDQFLFSKEVTAGLLLYGLWWPWGGDGNNISMRVGLAGDVSTSESMDLRELFNALDY